VTLVILTGSWPATLTLALPRSIRNRMLRQSWRAPCSPPLHPCVPANILRQTDRRTPSAPTSSSLTPRPNPHSARRHRQCTADAISCLGLALFGRRLHERVARSSMPASENLVWGLSVSREKSPCIESLRCGTATLLLGCAERSKPRSRVRRAEGAGLDGECAARVTIIVAATYKPYLVCGFSFHRM
jgi:hypothetical protein